MERYRYERDARVEHLFRIFDSLRGHVDSAAIAQCRNEDIAQKIVDALNATCSK